MIDHPHTLYPVTQGSLDNVVGVVSTRELWHRTLVGESTAIREAMKPALFVPQLAPVLDVTEQMRRRQSPMALVIDEYGGMDGLLTFNDLISDIIGELDIADPNQVKGAVHRGDGSWLLDGILPAHETRELLDIKELPGEAEGRFETIGGFVMDQLGRIPQAGETVISSGHIFEVVDMDGNRVDKIIATRLPQPEVEDIDR
jgi:putative hemolysin